MIIILLKIIHKATKHTLKNLKMNSTEPYVKQFNTQATIIASVVVAVFSFIVVCLVGSCCYTFLSSLDEYTVEDVPSWSTEVRNNNRKIRKRRSNRQNNKRKFKLSQQIKSCQSRRKSIFIV